MKILAQWDLKPNSRVELPDGSMITFEKMDGMYAHWIDDNTGLIKIGNFEYFIETDFGYKVISEEKANEIQETNR